MADDVEERLVAREREVVGRAVGADRLLALAVQVAPVGQEVRARDDPERVRARERQVFGGAKLDPEIAGRRDPQTVEADADPRPARRSRARAGLRPADWPAGEGAPGRGRSDCPSGRRRPAPAGTARPSGAASAGSPSRSRPAPAPAGSSAIAAARRSRRSRTRRRRTLNVNAVSQAVCRRRPGEPRLRSPSRTTIRSPARRKPRATRISSVLTQGRMLLRLTSRASLAPLLATAVL